MLPSIHPYTPPVPTPHFEHQTSLWIHFAVEVLRNGTVVSLEGELRYVLLDLQDYISISFSEMSSTPFPGDSTPRRLGIGALLRQRLAPCLPTRAASCLPFLKRCKQHQWGQPGPDATKTAPALSAAEEATYPKGAPLTSQAASCHIGSTKTEPHTSCPGSSP